ncbi:MAG: hypothetical protein GDA56_22365 [Hormoscilla sp. GM7CHS1pb]|nr:hypothetical protein [Hormoscilla sp. GM7CHS1pb]
MPTTLYFAFKEIPEKTQIRPYLFAAKVHSLIEPRYDNGRKVQPIPGFQQQKVMFTDVR